jgi:hypothetical protein
MHLRRCPTCTDVQNALTLADDGRQAGKQQLVAVATEKATAG